MKQAICIETFDTQLPRTLKISRSVPFLVQTLWKSIVTLFKSEDYGRNTRTVVLWALLTITWSAGNVCDAQEPLHPTKRYHDSIYNFSMQLFPEYASTGPPTVHGTTRIKSFRSAADGSTISIMLHTDRRHLLAAKYSRWLMDLAVRPRANGGRIMEKERLSRPLEGSRYLFAPKGHPDMRMQLYQCFSGDHGRLVELLVAYPQAEHNRLTSRIHSMIASMRFGASPFSTQSTPDVPLNRIVLLILGQFLLVLLLQIGSTYAVARLALKQPSMKNAIKYSACVFSIISLITLLALVVPLLMLKGLLSQQLAGAIALPLAMLLSSLAVLLPLALFKRLYHTTWFKSTMCLLLHVVFLTLSVGTASYAVGLASGVSPRTWIAATMAAPTSQPGSAPLTPPAGSFVGNIKGSLAGFLPDAGTSSSSSPSATQEPAQLYLQGISWQPNKALAIIDGEFLQEGESINGYTVRAIERDRVILSRGEDDILILTVGGR